MLTPFDWFKDGVVVVLLGVAAWALIRGERQRNPPQEDTEWILTELSKPERKQKR